jgi:hypothetical protein
MNSPCLDIRDALVDPWTFALIFDFLGPNSPDALILSVCNDGMILNAFVSVAYLTIISCSMSFYVSVRDIIERA